MTAHLSALALDALALGDPTAASEASVHLETCARCRADAEAAAAARREFFAGGYARTLAAATRTRAGNRARWRWLVVALPALASAAVITVLWLTRAPAAPPGSTAVADEPELAIKGNAILKMFANRDGRVFPVRDHTVLAAGDRIRFVIEASRARYVMIASIDGAGAATLYVPFGGSASAPLAAGGHAELPGSIVLDAAPGPERVFALLSDQPLAADDVLARLRAIGAGGRAAIESTRALELPTVGQPSLIFDKAAP